MDAYGLRSHGAHSPPAQRYAPRCSVFLRLIAVLVLALLHHALRTPGCRLMVAQHLLLQLLSLQLFTPICWIALVVDVLLDVVSLEKSEETFFIERPV